MPAVLVTSGFFVQVGGWGAIPALRDFLARRGVVVKDDCLRKRLKRPGVPLPLSIEPGEVLRRIRGEDIYGNDTVTNSVAMSHQDSCWAWWVSVDSSDGRRRPCWTVESPAPHTPLLDALPHTDPTAPTPSGATTTVALVGAVTPTPIPLAK